MNDFAMQPASPAKQAAIVTGVGALMIAIAGIAVWTCRENVARGFEGPLAVSTADLLKARKPGDLASPWISYKAENVVETDVELVESKAGTKTVQAEFHLVQVGDQWLIAAMPPKFRGTKVKGEINNTGHALWKEARAKVEETTSDVHGGKLLPYQLHGYIDYGQNQKAFLYVMGGLATVGTLMFLGGICALIVTSRAPKEGPSDFAMELGQVRAWSQ
jgi:hypothetical protein